MAEGRASAGIVGRRIDGVFWPWAALPVLLVGLVGCPPRPSPPPPPFVPMHEAIARVNANVRLVQYPLVGKGLSARGHITDAEGQVRHFDLRGWIIYRRPRLLRMRLDQLGQLVLDLGSNETEYWLWLQPEVNTYWHGRHDRVSQVGERAMPVCPDQLIEALGLEELPSETRGPHGPVYRVVPEANQLLFLAYTEADQGFIRKEYWLDRYDPGLPRRIVFRAPDGREIMSAWLDDYRPVGWARHSDDDGRSADRMPLAARHVRVRWPQSDAELELRVGRWVFQPRLGVERFRSPAERGQTFDRVISLDG